MNKIKDDEFMPFQARRRDHYIKLALVAWQNTGNEGLKRENSEIYKIKLQSREYSKISFGKKRK